ncbi:MAG: glucosamine-6-phosphate deaminase [Herpetosiphon sp.]
MISSDEFLTRMTVERLAVMVYGHRQAMGSAAARDVASMMQELLTRQERVRMVFAAAPSQNEFLWSLAKIAGVDWSRVTAFHMDEYLGLPNEAPQGFGRFLRDRLFDIVQPGEVHLIESSRDVTVESRRYASLLTAAPLDIICLGIGENGHIAFNDPDVADFDDPDVVKPVALDDMSRQQQVNDGCFPIISSVPTYALTLTIPTLMSGRHLFCMVPGASKRTAVQRTLNGPVSIACPASVLREHPDCRLYLDTAAYGEIEAGA